MYGQVIIIDDSWLSSNDQSDYEPVNNISALNTSATALGFYQLKFSKDSQSDICHLMLKENIAAVYDNVWFLANVLELSSDNEYFHCNFMKSNVPARSFTWSKSKDQCWMSSSHIPMEVSHCINCLIMNLTKL